MRGLIPFQTPSNLEAGNLNMHMAVSNVEDSCVGTESSSPLILISETHTQNQLQFNPMTEFMPLSI